MLFWFLTGIVVGMLTMMGCRYLGKWLSRKFVRKNFESVVKEEHGDKGRLA